MKAVGITVATVLTACGIETMLSITILTGERKLQQYLPLAVLKLKIPTSNKPFLPVATVLTACGIETSKLIL